MRYIFLLLLALAPSQQEAVEALFRGDKAFEAGDYKLAVQEYTTYLDSTGRGLLTTLTALTNRSAARGQLGDFDGAIEDCTRAIKLGPKYAIAYSCRAWARRMKGEHDAALEDYSKALELNPKNAATWAGRSLARIQKDDLAGALEDCEAALKIDARNVDALLAKAKATGLRHEWKESIAAATRAIEVQPKNAQSYYFRGAALAQSGDPTSAMADFDRSVELDPKDANAWSARGCLKRINKNYEGAIADYARSLELDPRKVMTLLDRAQMHLERGAWDLAVADGRQALKLSQDGSAPSAPIRAEVCRIFVARGVARQEDDNRDGALEDFTAAVAADPTAGRPHQGIGKVHLDRKEFKEAVASLTKAIDLDPMDLLSRFFRSEARCTLGDYELGLADADRGLELSGKGLVLAKAHWIRGACLLGLKRWEGAREEYARALKEAKEDWERREAVEAVLSLLPDLAKENPSGPASKTLLSKGKDLISAGQSARGIAVVEESVAIDASLLDAHETLALAYDAIRDKPGMARRAIEEVFEVEKEGKGLPPALTRILRKWSPFVFAGILWMTDHQMPDGRWSGDGFADVCPAKENRCEGKSEPGQDLRATSFVLLACLGAGYSHLSKDNFDTKSMGDRIKAALQWMIALQDKEGKLGASVEEHAIATLVLSEAYGMTASAPLKEPAQKAVAFLMSLKRSEGAWPGKAKAEAVDVQATGWALMALASARASELTFEAAAIEESVAALRKLGPPELVVLAASRLLKRKDEEDLGALAGRMALPRKDPPAERDALRVYLGTMAARLGDAARWEEWRSALKEGVMSTFISSEACRDASSDPVGKADVPRGRLMTTALTVLALEVHYGYANTLCALAAPAKR